jgi:cyclophilin family peptidyl-prolyl cis-trans isomerase
MLLPIYSTSSLNGSMNLSLDYYSGRELLNEHGLRRRSTFHNDEDIPSPSLQGHDDRQNAVSAFASSCNSHDGNSNYSNVTTPMARKIWSVVRIIQFGILIAVSCWVYDAYFKLREASIQLEKYKNEESNLIDQMDSIEDRATQLREQLKKLREEHTNFGEDAIQKTKEETKNIQNEIYKWKREYFELNKEVHALQDFMQQGAKDELKKRYGGDAVIVTLNLEVETSSDTPITIELFDEAPHASWIFVQQIENGDWESTSFLWHPAHMVLASPSKPASVRLEFVERSYHHHEAWTVGLTKSQNGGYNIYVNLQDNSHVHEADVCLGRVISGFDTLKKLMHRKTVAKTHGGEKSFLDPSIPINSFSVSSGQRRRQY